MFSSSTLKGHQQNSLKSAISCIIPLNLLKKGERAEIVGISDSKLMNPFLPQGELEQRLLEIGFIEGAELKLLHEGLFGRDPMAIQIQYCSTVAIRRQEASAIFVKKIGVK